MESALPSQQTDKQTLRSLIKAIGPGVLMAAAAIGGSHVVASTQAGALYGWQLASIVILVNLFKYPFFRFAQEYSAATGENLLAGYQRMGKGYLWAFFVLNFATCVMNIAGVSMISASLLTNFGITFIPIPYLTLLIMLLCIGIIVLGRYRALDTASKIIMIVMSVSTVAAFIAAYIKGPAGDPAFIGESVWQVASIGFIIQLMGWMPGPIEISVWPSLWMDSHAVKFGRRQNVREAVFDFHVGYFTSAVLAVVFLGLGALIIYGTGEEPARAGGAFAQQLIRMYTESMGSWAYPLISLAAFTTMFGTALTCIDAWPRSLAVCTSLFMPSTTSRLHYLHIVWILLSCILAAVIVLFYVQSLGGLLSFAMILSFLTAPVFAFLNMRLIQQSHVPQFARPGKALLLLSWAGFIFLSGFSVLFLVWQAGWLK